MTFTFSKDLPVSHRRRAARRPARLAIASFLLLLLGELVALLMSERCQPLDSGGAAASSDSIGLQA